MASAPPGNPNLRALGGGQIVAGRFRLEGEKPIGVGGMGVVWLARDESLRGKIVALKFVKETLASDAMSVSELQEEVIACQRLTHPHIIRVHDFIEDRARGLAGVSMEYAEGGTLHARRATRPNRWFEPEELWPWVEQLCQALAYAHEQCRIVHRDLKPSNLLLGAHDELKVADFGIAYSLQESFTRCTNGPSSGTPAYMSPEQARGQTPHLTDDLYALGATLYDLLTGKPPFLGSNQHVVLGQVLDPEVVPPSIASRRKELRQVDSTLPAHWEETIAGLLSKKAGHRRASARAAAAALSSPGAGVARLPLVSPAVPADSLRTTRRVRARRRRRWWLAGLTLLLLALAGGGLWLYTWSGAPALEPAAPADSAPDVPTTDLSPPLQEYHRLYADFFGKGPDRAWAARVAAKPEAEIGRHNMELAKAIQNRARSVFQFLPARLTVFSAATQTFDLYSPATSQFPDDAVVLSEAGLVGRVQSVAGAMATAITILNPSFRAAVAVEGTREQAIVTGVGKTAVLLYLSRQANLSAGQKVFSSGIGGIFPAGLLVGKVNEFFVGGLSGYGSITPAVELKSLDYVLIVNGPRR